MNEKEGKLKFWDKLKKIKHIEVYIAIIFIVILLLIYLSTTSNKASTNEATTNETTISSYVDDLETNLEDVLSRISGVSDVKVMITLDMSTATITDSKITLDSMPKIKGVIVTAKGVNNTATKMQVLQAVEAVLEITNGNIQILSSE